MRKGETPTDLQTYPPSFLPRTRGLYLPEQVHSWAYPSSLSSTQRSHLRSSLLVAFSSLVPLTFCFLKSHKPFSTMETNHFKPKPTMHVKYFPHSFGGNYCVTLTRGKLHAFCVVSWSSYNVGWPAAPWTTPLPGSRSQVPRTSDNSLILTIG